MPDKEPFITFTSEQCLIRGIAYPRIPLLINYNNQILEVASDWLRYLVVMRRKAAESVRQFAYHAKYWWAYLNRVGIAWNEVDDFVMLAWRDEYLRKGIDESTVNGYISTIFRMYIWAEKNGYTYGLIGEADWDRNFRPPLSVEIIIDRGGAKKFVSPLLIKTTAKPILPTPTNDEITKIHEALADMYGANVDLMIRDGLILFWMELTGIRRKEVLSLKQSQIPDWDEIFALEESSEKKEVAIVGKGGKKRSIWIGADVLIQTRDYIEEERQAIVSRMRKRFGSNYKNSGEIFLSSTTGRKLHEDSISQKFAKAFRKAGVRGSGHRVRARFLTNLVESAFEREVERLGSVPDLTSVLLPVAQIAGHSNVETLKPYLAVARKRLLRQTVAERKAAVEERATAVERRLKANLNRLRSTDFVRELVEAIESRNKKRIIAELQKLQSIYSP